MVAPRSVRRGESRDWVEDLPLWGAAGLIATVIWRAQDVLHVPGFVQPVWASLLFALAAAMVGRTVWQRTDVLTSPIARGLIVFAVIALLSVVTSIAPRASSSFFLKRIVPSLVLAWSVAVAIRGARDVEWLVAATVLGAAAFSLHALAVGYSGQDGRWTGFAFYDPNDLALQLVAVTPLAAYYFRRGTSLMVRAAAAGAIGLYLLALVRTESRGGLLGLAVVGGYVLVAFEAIPRRVRILGLVGGVLALGGLATGRYWSRIQTVLQPKTDYNLDRNDPTGRLQLWKRGLGYAVSRPVLGVGLNAYIVAERELSPIAHERRIQARPLNFLLIAHNTFIQIAAELGFAAVGVFLFILWRTRKGLVLVGRARRAAGADAADRAAALARALTGALLGFVVCGLFLSAPYFSLLYLLFGLAIGLERAAVPEPVATAAAPAGSDVDTPPRGWRAALSLPGRGGLVRGATPARPEPRLPTGRGGAW